MKNEAKIVKKYLELAVDEHVAYLHITHHLDPKTDPLDVEFYLGRDDIGAIAKVNLRDEYLEVFGEDGDCLELVPGVAAALRKLADDIEAIHAKAMLKT